MEWARCEPVEGEIDEEALARYAAVVDGCRARGLVPVVVLHDHGHPRWLGHDFWLRLEAPARFGTWAATAAARLGGDCRHWISLEEPNALAVRGWLAGTWSPARLLAPGDVVRALDHLMAAHVLAHTALHRLQPEARVATTVAPSAVYELGPLVTDVVRSRAAGVPRDGLHDWLSGRRWTWYAARDRPTTGEAARRRVAQSVVPLEQALPRTIDAVWAAHHEDPLDDLAVELVPPDREVAGLGPAAAGHGALAAAIGRTVESAFLGSGGRR